MKAVTLDPVSLEILWTRLVGIVDEAAATFVRASFSTLVRESNDYAVVLADASGNSLAQSTLSIPPFIGTLPATIRHFLERFPAHTLCPGDALITNDPWLGTGHLPDVSMAMPIFAGDKLVAFAGVVSHMPDIGGRLWNSGIREIFEEGLQIPPVKLIEAGQPNQVLLDILARNVRVPEQTLGDLWGQVAACRMLGERLLDLTAQTGVEVESLSEEICGRSERVLRNAIQALPDGDYDARIEGDGFEEPVVIATRVSISGSDMLIDFTGSSAQLPRAVNTVPAYAFAYAAFAVKAMLAPDVPNNEGSFRALRTFAPEGCIVNPRYPAACGARGMIGQLIPPAVMAALAEVASDRVQAAPGSPQCSFTVAGANQGRRFSTISFVGAGQGGGAPSDGLSAISFPGNVANTPIEVMEANAPILIHRREIRRGSGGQGIGIGGDGQRLELQLRADEPAVASFIMNRYRIAAPGLSGGEPGTLGALSINGTSIDPAQHWVMQPNDRFVMETAGGGGYGPPAERRSRLVDGETD